MKRARNTVLSLIIILWSIHIAFFYAVCGEVVSAGGSPGIQKIWKFLPDPVFKINDQEYSRQEFRNFAKSRINPNQIQYLTEEKAKKFAPRLISEMIEFELLMKCIAKDNIIPSKELVFNDMDKKFKALSEQEKQQATKEISEKFGLNFDEYKRKCAADKKTQQQAALEIWIATKIKPSISVSNTDIKQFYDESGELINASHIVIEPKANNKTAKGEARKKAESIYSRLKKGEKFADLAKESSCPNPDLGEFGRGKMVKEFDDAAFKLKIGEYSQVVESPFGFHIIKLNNRRKRQLPPFEQVKDRIKAQLVQMRIQDAMIARARAEKENSKIINFYKNRETAR